MILTNNTLLASVVAEKMNGATDAASVVGKLGGVRAHWAVEFFMRPKGRISGPNGDVLSGWD